MSKFEVSDEAISSMWDWLAAELNELGALGDRSGLILGVARSHFHSMVLSFPDYVLTGVTDSTGGTMPALGLTIRDWFRGHMARLTQDLINGGICH